MSDFPTRDIFRYKPGTFNEYLQLRVNEIQYSWKVQKNRFHHFLRNSNKREIVEALEECAPLSPSVLFMAREALHPALYLDLKPIDWVTAAWHRYVHERFYNDVSTLHRS